MHVYGAGRYMEPPLEKIYKFKQQATITVPETVDDLFPVQASMSLSQALHYYILWKDKQFCQAEAKRNCVGFSTDPIILNL